MAQAESTSHALRCSHDADQRRRLFHLIKGSANGVGAFELAALAGQGEADADNPAHVQHVLAAIDRVRFEIDRLTEVV